jgi:gliding motility-associated-like protein
LLAFNAIAQINLVPNGSFEEDTMCPHNQGELDLAYPWFNSAMGSPDYYNRCDSGSSPIAGVPYNLYGYKQAQNGNAYAGFVTYCDSTFFPNCREYVSVKLNQELVAGKKYYISFYVSSSSYTQYVTNNLGALFSSDTSLFSTYLRIPKTPQVVFHQILTDTANWVLLEDSFMASGGEKFLTIGNFFTDAQTLISTINTSTATIPNAYYDIDNVKVVELTSISIPNIVTPNNDNVNDVFFISGLPQNAELIIYNRWGNTIYHSQNYDNTFGFKDCNDGTYFYYLKAANKTYKGFIQVIR